MQDFINPKFYVTVGALVIALLVGGNIITPAEQPLFVDWWTTAVNQVVAVAGSVAIAWKYLSERKGN